MNPNTVKLVQETWEAVESISAQAADLFYKNLFEEDPSVKDLFKSNMQEQGARLMNMIGAAVHNLDRTDTLLPVLEALAKRHLNYGVKSEHYGTVGKVLLLTLEQGLGEAFTPDVKAAWSEVYTYISDVMRGAAYSKAG